MKHLLLRSLFVLPLLASISLGQTLYTPGGTIGNNTTNGNVGIGTSNPQQKLDVSGTIRSTGLQLLGGDNLTLQWWNAGAPANQTFAEFIESNGVFTGRFVNDAYNAADSWLIVNRNSGTYTVKNVNFPAGNVGIGTTSPSAPLTIESGATAGPLSNINDNNTYIAMGQWKGAGGHDYRIGIDNSTMWFGAWNNYRWYRTQTGGIDMVLNNGNLGIGTTNPTYPLTVNGTVRAKEVIVDTGWSDYVFDKNYKLPALSETEAAIKSEKHLPGIPSAQEVAAKGINVGEMQAKLLAKIEELTLHQIEQEKGMIDLKKENEALKARVGELEGRQTKN